MDCKDGWKDNKAANNKAADGSLAKRDQRDLARCGLVIWCAQRDKNGILALPCAMMEA